MKRKVSRKGRSHEDDKRSDGEKFIDDELIMNNGCKILQNSSKINKLEEQMEHVHQTLKSLNIETIMK